MLIDSLAAGFALFFTPLAIGLTVAGVLFGIVVGALPGLGPLMGIILMLPCSTDPAWKPFLPAGGCRCWPLS